MDKRTRARGGLLFLLILVAAGEGVMIYYMATEFGSLSAGNFITLLIGVVIGFVGILWLLSMLLHNKYLK